jgi:hypothetical protein
MTDRGDCGGRETQKHKYMREAETPKPSRFMVNIGRPEMGIEPSIHVLEKSAEKPAEKPAEKTFQPNRSVFPARSGSYRGNSTTMPLAVESRDFLAVSSVLCFG